MHPNKGGRSASSIQAFHVSEGKSQLKLDDTSVSRVNRPAKIDIAKVGGDARVLRVIEQVRYVRLQFKVRSFNQSKGLAERYVDVAESRATEWR